MALNVKPTRSELMKLKKQIKLAKSGHSLLKKKRDGLILEFFEILKKVKTLRSELVAEFKLAQQKLNMARLRESDLAISSLALAISKIPVVELKTKNIMGVVVPKIESPSLQKAYTERGFGLFNSIAVQEAAEAYEKVVEKILLAAEVETSMRKVLAEIEQTKRRVNALEFSLIPKMEKLRSFIRLRLEEMERESIFGLKHIKKKLAQA
ncbi:V-type ATP synthase subunit D [Candidatus Woesearchaeota archaeon]|nr:V-type ATP synthase subunit D [Candidatus Woesearchaeota archaeon]